MAAYREYDHLLEEAMKKGDNSTNDGEKPLSGPDDIKHEVGKLYQLKHFGKELENAKKNIVHQHRIARHEVTHEAPQGQKNWFLRKLISLRN